MTTTIESAGLTFVCSDPIEEWRARTILEKEPGTVAWIETFQPGEVFYDIGANIGVYSLLAAQRDCRVFAFEPHPGNYSALVKNGVENGFCAQGMLIASNVALAAHGRDASLYVRDNRRGSSGSQIGVAKDENGRGFIAARCMETAVNTLDELRQNFGQVPHHIKIDVDGQELKILYGARDTLERGVKSIQVETHPAQKACLYHYMEAFGYTAQSVHYTQNGQKAIDKGAKPESVVCNTIFRRGE